MMERKILFLAFLIAFLGLTLVMCVQDQPFSEEDLQGHEVIQPDTQEVEFDYSDLVSGTYHASSMDSDDIEPIAISFLNSRGIVFVRESASREGVRQLYYTFYRPGGTELMTPTALLELDADYHFVPFTTTAFGKTFYHLYGFNAEASTPYMHYIITASVENEGVTGSRTVKLSLYEYQELNLSQYGLSNNAKMLGVIEATLSDSNSNERFLLVYDPNDSYLSSLGGTFYLTDYLSATSFDRLDAFASEYYGDSSLLGRGSLLAIRINWTTGELLVSASSVYPFTASILTGGANSGFVTPSVGQPTLQLKGHDGIYVLAYNINLPDNIYLDGKLIHGSSLKLPTLSTPITFTNDNGSKTLNLRYFFYLTSVQYEEHRKIAFIPVPLPDELNHSITMDYTVTIAQEVSWNDIISNFVLFPKLNINMMTPELYSGIRLMHLYVAIKFPQDPNYDLYRVGISYTSTIVSNLSNAVSHLENVFKNSGGSG